jgi:hypothetical protein
MDLQYGVRKENCSIRELAMGSQIRQVHYSRTGTKIECDEGACGAATTPEIAEKAVNVSSRAEVCAIQGDPVVGK